MDIYTVSFFGHRQLENPFQIEAKLDELIRNLINNMSYVEFLVGREGLFDQLASSAIRKISNEYNYGNSELILILPYMKSEYRKNTDSFESYYDRVEICSESEYSHFKAAIQVRNRIMVDRSDLVICCIEHKSGGAYQTMKYAEKQGKKIINII